MNLQEIMNSVGKYLGLNKLIEEELPAAKIQSSEKSVCFVCWHGIGISPIYKDKFEEYLHQQGISDVNVFNSGLEFFVSSSPKVNDNIETLDKSISYMQNSDLVVILLYDIGKKFVKKFNPRGEVCTLKDICGDSLKDGQWEPIMYRYLMQK